MTIIPFGDVPRYHAEHKDAAAVALTYPDASLTWWELERRANQWARLLQSRGVGQDDFVAVALSNSSVFHEVAFGIWKLGATPSMVSPKLPAHELGAIIDLIAPRVLVADKAEAGPIERIAVTADLSGFDDAPFPSAVARYHKAMTSGGSTGRPKVIVDHMPAHLDIETAMTPSVLGFGPDSVMLNAGPLYHNAPFLFSTFGLFAGCHVVGMARFDAEEALRLIERHRVNWTLLVPTMMHRIWSLPREVRERYDVSSLKTVWHGAAACPPWLKEAWIDWLGAETIWEMYGGTEALGTTVIRGDEWLRKRGSVGRILGGSQIKVLREDGSECAPGEVGELYFKPRDAEVGPSHYIGDDAKRAADGWQSIGDLGHVDEEGYVFLADRRTDLILRGGANIYPAEIEAALDAHPSVGSSLVVGLPCDEMGQRVHAIVQPRAGEQMDVDDLHRFLAGRLVKYKLPQSYEVVDDLLRDDAGKARRSMVREERLAWLKAEQPFQIFPARIQGDTARA